MDLNLVVIAGRLACPPEIRGFESGARMMRMLVTVRTTEPYRRTDVVPVTWWEPQTERHDFEKASVAEAGQRVWVSGRVERRFWDATEGRRSRIEVVAEKVQLMSDARTEDKLEAIRLAGLSQEG